MKSILLIPFLFALLSIQLFSYEEFIDPNPSSENGFGKELIVLENGNVVISSPFAEVNGVKDCGAVYLFNGKTHKLISALYGHNERDFVGSGGIIKLTNSNYVVSSPSWNNSNKVNSGAVTWCEGTTGTSGYISATNSLIGTMQDDYVAASGSPLGLYSKESIVFALENGNYVVVSPFWDNGDSLDVGAVTWGDGTKGTTGVINVSNSLIGTKSFDRIGLIRINTNDQFGVGLHTLKNGNYVVFSPFWDNGDSINVGAVTWADGTIGITGKISETNSLIGSTSEDRIGCFCSSSSREYDEYYENNHIQIRELNNGNYVLLSPLWNNSSGVDAGAVTWASGAKGICGKINSNNSLISNNTSINSDGSSIRITILKNDNYIISNPYWGIGDNSESGAVTWCDGSIGTCGLVSIENSLVGNKYCTIGDGEIVTLNNGNYVFVSPKYYDTYESFYGAITWGDGSKMMAGKINKDNSIVYRQEKPDWPEDIEITLLNNDNYLVSNATWYYGCGAVTWGNGKIGTNGIVSSTNSLVGSTKDDEVGSNGIITLNNGNYLVCSSYWDNGNTIDAGAVTWGNGIKGTSGKVSAKNSLVGEKYQERIGIKSNILTLENGNYVINFPEWTKSNSVEVGAITWVDGTKGINGRISETINESNSLIGTFGSANITELQNGNFVVCCPNWGLDWLYNLGSITLCDGTKGTFGRIGTNNSFIGSRTNDSVGSGRVYPLTNGNFVVSSPNCSNGDSLRVGAVTWFDATKTSTGIISPLNSLVGCSPYDLGKVVTLKNGNYLVVSPYWNNGKKIDAGAVTWGSGTKGVNGVISVANSLIGENSKDEVGYGTIYFSDEALKQDNDYGGINDYDGIMELKNSNYIIASKNWHFGGWDYAALTVGNGNTGVCGTINSENSIIYLNSYQLDLTYNDFVSEYYIRDSPNYYRRQNAIYILPYDGLASASVATDSTQNNVTNKLRFSAEYPYPNPVNNSLAIKLKLIEDGNITVQICDVTGRVIQNLFSDELFIGIHNLTFGISSIRSGAYHLVISKRSESLSFPIQVVR